MTDYEFRRLRDRAVSRDMTDVCSLLGITIGTRGKWRECHCPNPRHDDRHPSCRINVQTNRFRCFSCGCHGNNIDLVQMVCGCDYNEAIRILTGESNMPVRSHTTPEPQETSDGNTLDLECLRNLVSPRDYYKALSPWAVDFLRHRRIDPNIIDAKAIVSKDQRVATQRKPRLDSNGKSFIPTFPAPSLLFPYRDENDIIINLQARLHDPAPGQRRFHFPVGSHTVLWNPRDALTLPDGADLWLCEGVSDAMALITSGRPALALASATGLTHDARDFIAKQAARLRMHIFSDRDRAGEQLYQKLLTLCPALRRHNLPDGYKDFGAAWAAGAIEAL